MIKSILVPMKNHAGSFMALRTAVDLFGNTGGFIRGLFIQEENQGIDDRQEVMRQFTQITSDIAVQKTLETEKGNPAEVILQWEKSADLTIAGRPPVKEGRKAVLVPGKTTSALMDHCRNPLMIAGKSLSGTVSIIFSYGPDEASSRCLRTAGDFSGLPGCRLTAVISENEENRGVLRIKSIENYFKAYGCKPKIFWKRTGPARAVIETAEEDNSAIILMGISRKNPWRGILFEDPSVKTAKNTENPIVFCA